MDCTHALCMSPQLLFIKKGPFFPMQAKEKGKRSQRSKENVCCLGLGVNKLVCNCSGFTCTISFVDSLYDSL